MRKLLSFVAVTLSALLLSALPALSATAISGQPTPPSYRLSCGSECNGEPKATLSSCLNSYVYKPVRYAIYVNGSKEASFDVAPGKCNSRSVYVNDTNVVSSKFCYLNRVGGSCATSFVNIGSSHTVIVPKLVEMAVTGWTVLENGSTAYTLNIYAPQGPAYYSFSLQNETGAAVSMVVGGQTLTELRIGNNNFQTVTIEVPTSTNATYVAHAYENSAYTMLSGCDVPLAVSVY